MENVLIIVTEIGKVTFGTGAGDVSYKGESCTGDGGKFYWRQDFNAIDSNCSMVYGAMFDEVDEGTATFKIAATPANQPANCNFVPLNVDGCNLPSDWYLRLANEAGKMLRGEIPLQSTMPISPPASGKALTKRLKTIPQR